MTNEIDDSDHKALFIQLDLDTLAGINLYKAQAKKFLVYKRTNWDLFTKFLYDNYTLNIPDNINLNNDEMNTYINQFSNNNQLACLFSIFTAHMIDAFDLNTNNATYSMVYANDRIIYVAGSDGYEIADKLNIIVNKAIQMYAVWNLKVNPTKSETILFRNTIEEMWKKKDSIKNFNIKIRNPENNVETVIPHKNIFKYLGVHIDQLARCSSHIDIQINKARKRYKALGHLFHNKYINKKARIICYLLLIRPLLTYGLEVLWNISASQMEYLRSFERKCLRTSLLLYRSYHTNYYHHVSNKILYDTAEIPRIDNFILELTRNYYNKMMHIENRTIYAMTIYPPEEAIGRARSSDIKPQYSTYYKWDYSRTN